MKFDLRSPCGNCPFRNDRHPFGLRADRVRSILGGGKGRAYWPAVSFPCHQTIDYDRDDGGATVPPTAQQCAGVMIILVREGRFNDAMQIAHRLGMFDPAGLDMDAPVYATTEDAIKGQEQWDRPSKAIMGASRRLIAASKRKAKP